MNEDLLILDYLRQQKLQGIRFLYCRYADSMEMIAYYFLGDKTEAKYLVGEVVWDLWLHHGFVGVEPPLRKFLYSEIKKACHEALKQTA
jgi:hypothetical protein